MRISRPQMFMQAAEVFAQRATCFRGSIGAAVVQDRDIVSIGYNGPPPGELHCIGNGCPTSETGGCLRSIHAEKNAIDRAMRKLDRDLEGCDLYCTYSPCKPCAELIFNSRVNRFYFRHSYRLPDGLNYLKGITNSMGIYKVTPSGIIISQRSGEIVEAVE